MEFRQIRYALAVASQRSFTRAAARLGVSQSAISEQVQLLERELRFALFRRGGRGVEVTERGHGFLLEAERVLADMQALEDTARRLRDATAEPFLLGLADGVAPLVLPRLAGDAALAGSDIRLEVVTAPWHAILRDLQADRLDAGIAFEAGLEALPVSLQRDHVADVEIVLVARPDHGLARAAVPVPVAHLESEPLVASPLATGHGAAAGALLADAGMRPPVRTVANDVECVKAMVQAGAGVALLPRAVLDRELALGLLVALPIKPARVVPCVILRRRQTLSRTRQAFLDRLRTLLAR